MINAQKIKRLKNKQKMFFERVSAEKYCYTKEYIQKVELYYQTELLLAKHS